MNERAKKVETAVLASGAGRLLQRAEKEITGTSLGEIVTIREAKLADVLPFIHRAAEDHNGFVRQMTILCVSVDGDPITAEIFDGMAMHHFRAVQALLPAIMEVNGMGNAEAPGKKD